jgi:hypothetical protein
LGTEVVESARRLGERRSSGDPCAKFKSPSPVAGQEVFHPLADFLAASGMAFAVPPALWATDSTLVSGSLERGSCPPPLRVHS